MVTASAEGGVSREEVIDSVASDILHKLPAVYDLAKVRKSYEMNITPTIVVLLQELERFNVLITRIHSTLTQLRKVRSLFTY